MQIISCSKNGEELLHHRKEARVKFPFLSPTTHVCRDGWGIYSPMEDYARLGLDVSPWRVSPLNFDWMLCDTYPQ